MYVCMQGPVEDQINLSEQATLLKYILNKINKKNKIVVNVVGPYHLLHSCILSYPLDINELELTELMN